MRNGTERVPFRVPPERGTRSAFQSFFNVASYRENIVTESPMDGKMYISKYEAVIDQAVIEKTQKPAHE